LSVNNRLIYGWVNKNEYSLFKRIFKSEKFEDGRIEKWNRDNHYTLIFDANGNLIRKEND
jgi:hypothetical protein